MDKGSILTIETKIDFTKKVLANYMKTPLMDLLLKVLFFTQHIV